MKNKKIERICKNCQLYDEANQECSIIVLHEGQKLKVPMSPSDQCLYEENYFNPIDNKKENLISDIKQIKMWVENDKGEKINGNGIVKIEYPED